MVTIFHNPRCSKSRQTLGLLEERGVQAQVHLYLDEAVDADLLKKAYNQFGDAFLRKGEDDYKAHFKGKDLSVDEVVTLLQKYPKVMERPLVVNGDKLALGRPPESVEEIL